MKTKKDTRVENITNEHGEVLRTFYDRAYFTELNDSGHEYTLDNRREIEGNHPQVIIDTFGDDICVLDCGCGPGLLLLFLKELGIEEMNGFDFSPAAIGLAPEGIKEHLWVGRIDDRQMLCDNNFDLVICRETFEHLTPLQMVKAIGHMRDYCKVGGHIYMTCRISQSENPLEWETDFDVDPSHVCLLTRELLEFFFEGLYGLKPRKDLEASMDHMGKGRCFVYERVV